MVPGPNLVPISILKGRRVNKKNDAAISHMFGEIMDSAEEVKSNLQEKLIKDAEVRTRTQWTQIV